MLEKKKKITQNSIDYDRFYSFYLVFFLQSYTWSINKSKKRKLSINVNTFFVFLQLSFHNKHINHKQKNISTLLKTLQKVMSYIDQPTRHIYNVLFFIDFFFVVYEMKTNIYSMTIKQFSYICILLVFNTYLYIYMYERMGKERIV